MCRRDQVRSAFGIHAASWNNELGESHARWILKCTALVAGMIACALCGQVAFQTGSSLNATRWTTIMPSAPHAPAVLANMHLREHAMPALQ